MIFELLNGHDSEGKNYLEIAANIYLDPVASAGLSATEYQTYLDSFIIEVRTVMQVLDFQLYDQKPTKVEDISLTKNPEIWTW